MKNNNFKPYDHALLKDIIEHPRDHCKDPYQLLTSYLVNCIADLIETEDIWESLTQKNITVPVKTFNRYLADCVTDFMQAGINGTTIRINGEGFTIRKINTINCNNIRYIFQFPIVDGQKYLLQFVSIYNIKSEFLTDFDNRKDRYEDDKLYFKQVMVMALDDQNNGWDKLTDMEAAMYCWANDTRKVPMSKRINEEWIPGWYSRNESCFSSITLKEIKDCFRSNEPEDINTMYPFSKEKVLTWNKEHDQESFVEKISEQDANDIWFNLIRPKYKRKL